MEICLTLTKKVDKKTMKKSNLLLLFSLRDGAEITGLDDNGVIVWLHYNITSHSQSKLLCHKFIGEQSF